jgi:hypothetical protein
MSVSDSKRRGALYLFEQAYQNVLKGDFEKAIKGLGFNSVTEIVDRFDHSYSTIPNAAAIVEQGLVSENERVRALFARMKTSDFTAEQVERGLLDKCDIVRHWFLKKESVQLTREQIERVIQQKQVVGVGFMCERADVSFTEKQWRSIWELMVECGTQGDLSNKCYARQDLPIWFLNEGLKSNNERILRAIACHYPLSEGQVRKMWYLTCHDIDFQAILLSNKKADVPQDLIFNLVEQAEEVEPHIIVNKLWNVVLLRDFIPSLKQEHVLEKMLKADLFVHDFETVWASKKEKWRVMREQKELKKQFNTDCEPRKGRRTL